ncbi:hypothetical protein ACNFH5_17630 [Pseudomonas sp. NY15435]
MAAFESALAPKWSQHFTLARASAHAAEMPASVVNMVDDMTL